MFRAVASLLLFGALSPLSPSLRPDPGAGLLAVAPPPPAVIRAVARRISASGALVMDLLGGRELFARSPEKPRAIASLAKIMTAIVVVEGRSLEESVRVPDGVASVQGTTAGLRAGEIYTVEDLLGALLVGSANDAASVLAATHTGGTEAFVAAMNARAQTLGLRHTRFRNPIGFDEEGQESTPRDLAWLAMYAWKNPLLRSLVGRRSLALRERTGGREFTLFSTNHLLTSHPSSFLGLKTGTTVLAGECLISLAVAEGRPYVLVVLGSRDRYGDTLTLLEALSGKRA